MLSHFSTKDHFPAHSQLGSSLRDLRESCIAKKERLFQRQSSARKELMQTFKQFSNPQTIFANSQRRTKKSRQSDIITDELLDSMVFEPTLTAPAQLFGGIFGNAFQRHNLGLNNQQTTVQERTIDHPFNQLFWQTLPDVNNNQAIRPRYVRLLLDDERNLESQPTPDFSPQTLNPLGINLTNRADDSFYVDNPENQNQHEENDWESVEEENPEADPAQVSHLPVGETQQGILDSDDFFSFFAQTRTRIANNQANEEEGSEEENQMDSLDNNDFDY